MSQIVSWDELLSGHDYQISRYLEYNYWRKRLLFVLLSIGFGSNLSLLGVLKLAQVHMYINHVICNARTSVGYVRIASIKLSISTNFSIHNKPERELLYYYLASGLVSITTNYSEMPTSTKILLYIGVLRI